MSIQQLTKSFNVRSILALFVERECNPDSPIYEGDMVVFVDSAARVMWGVVEQINRKEQYALIHYAYSVDGRWYPVREWFAGECIRRYDCWIADGHTSAELETEV